MGTQWTTPAAEGSNLITTQADSLANGSESASFTLDNSTTKLLYGKIRITLGSITPATAASITLKIYGPNADIGGSIISSLTFVISTGVGAKVLEKVIQIPPFANNATLTNNAGVALAASGNGVYAQMFTEENV